MANVKWIFRLEFQAYYCLAIDNIRILLAGNSAWTVFALVSLSLSSLSLSIHGCYKIHIRDFANTLFLSFLTFFYNSLVLSHLSHILLDLINTNTCNPPLFQFQSPPFSQLPLGLQFQPCFIPRGFSIHWSYHFYTVPQPHDILTSLPTQFKSCSQS